MKKKFTRDEMLNKFESLPKNERIQYLWDAIDFMNLCNGERSRLECVFMTMRYPEDENGMWSKVED